jgi:PAS domain S-box-containing protein
MQAPLPPDESARLQALRDYDILDTAAETEFDDIAELGAQICGTPIALITLVDENRQWFKSKVGLKEESTSRDVAFCAHALLSPEILQVPDALADGRFADGPLVTGEPGIRFYAGAPLITPEGHTLGTLCVIDRVPRRLTAKQAHTLQVLSRHVMTQLQLRRHLREKVRTESDLRASLAHQAKVETALRLSEQEQRDLARRLEIEHARLVEAQASAKVGSWETDLATMAVVWSEETHRIFQTDARTFQPSHPAFLNLIHPDDRLRVDRAFVASLDEPSTRTIEHRILLPDGSSKTVEERWRTFHDDAGRPIRAAGTCQDITERKMAEEKLREQAALLDKAQDAIIVRNLDHRVLFWNRSAERLYGWKAEEALNQSVRTLLYRDPAAYERAIQSTVDTGEWVGEIEQFTRDGKPLTVEGRWTLVRDDEGRPKAILAINTDISERKILERQFLRAQRMESIGTLAGGIAHDLNNLLAPIVMGVDLLKRFGLNEQSLELVRNIERSARRGTDLVKQVLSFARGVEGSRVTVFPVHVVREVEAIAQNTFPKNITFESDAPKNVWPITGDPTQLNQVLLNLCVNARDAMPDGGRLGIRIRNANVSAADAASRPEVGPGRYVRIEVSDTGCGMSPGVIERIFEPFFTTKEMGKGTGLGLSTVLGIVRSHDGFIAVKSAVNEGSVFTLHLPAPLETSPRDPASLGEVEILPRGNGELVLVVDDEALVLNVTKQTLETFGYRVVTAEDGAQAMGVYALHRADIAVVLTDMMMPFMGGAALVAALIRLDPSIRIIAASGLSTNRDVINAGVRHFLAKPYTADALLSVLKAALDHSAAPPPGGGPV